jgi:hypothetical protein
MLSPVDIAALKAEARTPPEFAQLAEAFEKGTARFGAPLLSARSDREHDEVLNSTLEDPIFRIWYSELLKALTLTTLDHDAIADELSISTRLTSKRTSKVFGDSAPIANATLVLTAKVTRLFAKSKPDEVSFEAFSWDAFYSHELPGVVLSAMVDGVSAEIESLAMFLALERGRALAPRTSERLLRSLYAHKKSGLRVLTLIPGLKVPIALVPRKDRLNMQALHSAEHIARMNAASRSLVDLDHLLGG